MRALAFDLGGLHRAWRRLGRLARRLGLAPAMRSERLDLLYGSRAIARFMGLSRKQGRSVINARAIPSAAR